MTTLLVFASVLLVAVLISELAERSVLSTAVVFLAAGFVLGPGVLDVFDPGGGRTVETVAEIALFAVLFTDGQRIGARDLASAWRLPGRALLLGMPLTFLFTAVLAHAIVGLAWTEAFLLGAVLAPTDPVFASALVGREEVPPRLRHLLNVESGINDGLALPVVLVLLASLGGEETGAASLAAELAGGIALGVVVPWVAIKLEGSRLLSAHTTYEPLSGVAIGLLVFALAEATHANLFLAAFAAGITLVSTSPRLARAFHDFGELTAELVKLGALLLFGALISPAFLAEIPFAGWVFAALALFAVRPVALPLALIGSRLTRPEMIAAAWFGPRGFASVVYGLLVVQSGIDAADQLFHLVALVIAASIVAHSSTDVVVAQWFARAAARAERDLTMEERRQRREADREAEIATAARDRAPDH